MSRKHLLHDVFPGRTPKDGGRCFGGPMDGKVFNFSRPVMVLPYWRPIALGTLGPTDPVKIDKNYVTYRWNIFLGGYLYEDPNGRR